MERQRHDSDGFIFSYLALLFRVTLFLNRDSIRSINIYAKRCGFYLDLAIKE